MIILVELTGEYALSLPLLIAIVTATVVSNCLSADTIYTLKLRRRGIQIDRPRVVSVMRSLPSAQQWVRYPPRCPPAHR